MRRALQPRPVLLAGVLLAVTLAGCSREVDAFRPHLVITQPEAGAIARSADTVVRGYAVDDEGIASVRVNGTAVERRGGTAKIYPFAFKTATSGTTANYVIEAADLSGRSTKLSLPLRYDSKAPELEITKFEREGTTMRVTGIATDDFKVTSISIDGSRLSITAGRRVPFYAEATGEWVDIVVTDAAGNKVQQRAQ